MRRNRRFNVYVEAVGLCEFCGCLLFYERLRGDGFPDDEDFQCFYCQKMLTGKSFGYSRRNRKVVWVGKDGLWTRRRPQSNFDLDGWPVVVQPDLSQYH